MGYMAQPPGCKSKPIKDTPSLSNKEYDAWIKEVKANEKNKVFNKEYEKSKKAYEEIMKNSKDRL